MVTPIDMTMLEWLSHRAFKASEQIRMNKQHMHNLRNKYVGRFGAKGQVHDSLLYWERNTASAEQLIINNANRIIALKEQDNER